MDKAFLDSAQAVLRHDEGVRLQPYLDTKHLWTIGVGRLIGAQLINLKLSEPEVNFMLQNDIEKHWKDATEIFGETFLLSLDDPRKCAILTLIFTLGKEKLERFYETVPAIKQRKWQKAVDCLKQSKWSRDVDPRERVGIGRDDRVYEMFLTGKFPRDYKL